MEKRNELSVYGLLEHVSGHLPDAEAIYDYITSRKTYRALKNDVDHYADRLAARGIGKGDHVR